MDETENLDGQNSPGVITMNECSFTPAKSFTCKIAHWAPRISTGPAMFFLTSSHPFLGATLYICSSIENMYNKNYFHRSLLPQFWNIVSKLSYECCQKCRYLETCGGITMLLTLLLNTKRCTVIAIGFLWKHNSGFVGTGSFPLISFPNWST